MLFSAALLFGCHDSSEFPKPSEVSEHKGIEVELSSAKNEFRARENIDVTVTYRNRGLQDFDFVIWPQFHITNRQKPYLSITTGGFEGNAVKLNLPDDFTADLKYSLSDCNWRRTESGEGAGKGLYEFLDNGNYFIHFEPGIVSSVRLSDGRYLSDLKSNDLMIEVIDER